MDTMLRFEPVLPEDLQPGGRFHGSPLLEEVVDAYHAPGKHNAVVKWFNDKLGYGFCTVSDGLNAGRDVFVHHSGICPTYHHFRTLRKGESISLNITHGHNGPQGVDVVSTQGPPAHGGGGGGGGGGSSHPGSWVRAAAPPKWGRAPQQQQQPGGSLERWERRGGGGASEEPAV